MMIFTTNVVNQVIEDIHEALQSRRRRRRHGPSEVATAETSLSMCVKNWFAVNC